MLHRELLLVHVLLAQVHALLHIPLSIRTIPFMSRVTHPQLRAHLEGLDNTLLLALVSTTPLSTTPMSSLPPWASFILFNRARNNLKTNLKAAQTLAIGHPSLHNLIRITLLRLHRELPGPTTPLPGCLSLLVLRPLAMYHDLVFTYARDLALALVRPDLSLSVSPHTLPDSTKGMSYTAHHSVYTFHLFPVFSSSHFISFSFLMALDLVTSILHVEFHSFHSHFGVLLHLLLSPGVF